MRFSTLRLHLDDVRVQVLHFCYGLGAFVSPMIAEPFLLNEDCSLFVDNDTSTYGADLVSTAEGNHRSSDLANLELNATISLLPAKTLDEAQQMTKVRFAFWIMAALMVCIHRELLYDSTVYP